MCTVSMIADHYRDKWQGQGMFQQIPNVLGATPQVYVSRTEFDALKADVAEMKALLKRAKQYDIDNGEPDCEIDEKMALLRKVAEMVGVNLDDALKPQG